MQRIAQVIQSTFALPAWVLVWILVLLIPANLSGLFLTELPAGWWVAVLGSGALMVNAVIAIANGGMSKALAIPHLLFWLPLELILLHRWLTVADLTPFESTYILIILTINGISLVFDLYDTAQWVRGNRAIVGFEDQEPLI